MQTGRIAPSPMTEPTAEYMPKSRTGRSSLVSSESTPIAVVTVANVHGPAAILEDSTIAVAML